MNFKRLACMTIAAGLFFTSASHAFQRVTSTADSTAAKKNAVAQPTAPIGPEALSPLVTKPKDGLEARQPVFKPGIVRKPIRHMGMLIVKFGDPVISADAELADGSVLLNAAFADRQAQIKDLTQRFNVSFRQAVPHSQATLEDLYERAERNSGKMQVNLKSYMYVEGAEADLESVASLLNGMDIVEYVEWYEDTRPRGGLDLTGACCLPDDSCEVMSEVDCDGMGGTYIGDLTDCAPNPCNEGACCIFNELTAQYDCGEVDEETCHQAGGYFQGDGSVCDDGMGGTICDDYSPDCGEVGTGSCFWNDGENGTPYCNNAICCDIICDQDPFCCDEDDPMATWDEFCAQSANLYCASPPADRCATAFNESCLEPHGPGGCNNEGCCETVCAIEPFCCDVTWDSGCVNLALEECVEVAATDDYTPLQGYRTPQSYAAQVQNIPEALQNVVPILDGGALYTGFAGQGWNLFDDGDPFAGIYGLGQELIDNYGVDNYGEGVLTRGKTIKVAVIEWGYWGPEPYTDENDNDEYDAGEPFTDINNDGEWTANHEDLDVILEPGQTMFFNEAIAENNHGTACLGIINAQENGFGMTGIAPDAQAYFFPLTSVEEGPRSFAAWTSALNTLGPGDVISASYGGGGHLGTNAGMVPILQLATALGITTCVAAGNDCLDLGEVTDQGDSTAIAVGACSPGVPYYRLNFSNYYSGPAIFPQGDLSYARGNIVHISAWGSHVATCGYGGLSQEAGDPYRSYTTGFNGTSAAAPQIAGLVACLQGLAKQFYGIPLSPLQIRAALAFSRPASEYPPYGNRLFGGFDDTDGNCYLDFDPGEGPSVIWIYPRSAGTFNSAANTILNQSFVGFGDSPLVEDVLLLSGTNIFGSKFSTLASDNNYLVAQSESRRTSGPDVPANLPASIPASAIDHVRYLIASQTVDLLVQGRSPVRDVTSMTITAEYQPPANHVSIAMLEAYNWGRARWDFVNIDVHTSSAETAVVATVPGAQQYVRPSDQTVLYRLSIQTLGPPVGGNNLPSGGGPIRPVNTRIDWVNLEIQEGFASPIFGGGVLGGPAPGGASGSGSGARP